jgi:hypothetical protein
MRKAAAHMVGEEFCLELTFDDKVQAHNDLLLQVQSPNWKLDAALRIERFLGGCLSIPAAHDFFKGQIRES